MGYTEVVEESDRYRVSVELDEYADEPDVLGPLVRCTPGSYGDFRSVFVLTSDGGQEDNNGHKDHDLAWDLREAIEHYSDRHSNTDALRLAGTYMRLKYGTEYGELHWDNSGDYWYVGTGPAGEAYLAEYMAWATGDVWTVTVERRTVTYTKTYDYETGEKLGHTESRLAWEEVESVGGFYGMEYAEAEAKDLFKSYEKA